MTLERMLTLIDRRGWRYIKMLADDFFRGSEVEWEHEGEGLMHYQIRTRYTIGVDPVLGLLRGRVARIDDPRIIPEEISVYVLLQEFEDGVCENG